MRGPRAVCVVVGLSATMLACSSTGDPQPQLVIVVDIDAPTPGQVRDDLGLSADASVDTLRVDFISGGEIYATQSFTATEASEWPLSFGVRTLEGTANATVHLRLRAFRALLAEPEQVGDQTEPRPPPSAAIDRLVAVTLPAEGVVAHRVQLALDCIGRPPSFVSPQRTCIDAQRLDAAIDEGIEPGDDRYTTRAGSALLAREVPCTAPPSGDRVCIPGGFLLLGDDEIVGIEDGLIADAVPLRPVVLPPRWLDRTEVTVGEVRSLAAQLTLGTPMSATTGTSVYCTWLGETVATNDALPVNCVSRDVAREICQLRGGDLPSEAEWEHAASGRGQSRRFSWGDDDVACCGASIARFGTCTEWADFPEPAGSHPQDGCEGPGDVSRDGVLDMAGSMAEWCLDQFTGYDDPGGCWAEVGARPDPVCTQPTPSYSIRGGAWSSGRSAGLSALRARAVGPSPALGMRCSYDDQGG